MKIILFIFAFISANETNTRRTKRHRNQSYDLMMRQSLLNIAPSKPEKRKLKAVDVPHTAPVLSNRNDPENEPPRKRQRAQSYTGNKITRPSSTSRNSVRSMKTGAGTSKPTKTTEQHMAANDNHNRIAVFTQGFDEYIKKKTQEKLQWWKELLDVSEKGPIVHSVDEVDIEYINTKYGQLGMYKDGLQRIFSFFESKISCKRTNLIEFIVFFSFR